MKPISLLTTLFIGVTLLSSSLMASNNEKESEEINSKVVTCETVEAYKAARQAFKEENPSIYIPSEEEWSEDEFEWSDDDNISSFSENIDEEEKIISFNNEKEFDIKKVKNTKESNNSVEIDLEELEYRIALTLHSNLLFHINFSGDSYNRPLTEKLQAIVHKNGQYNVKGTLQQLINFIENWKLEHMKGKIKETTENYLELFKDKIFVSNDTLLAFEKKFY